MMEDNTSMTPEEEQSVSREPEQTETPAEETTPAEACAEEPVSGEEISSDGPAEQPVPQEEFAAEPAPAQEWPQEPAEAPIPAVEDATPIPAETVQEAIPEPPVAPAPPAAQPMPAPPVPPQAYPQPQWQAPVYPQAPVFRQETPQAPVYGAPQQGYAQPGYVQAPQQPYAQPVYGQPVSYQQPYYYPVPEKKKMSTGLKVFIWIASILAALAILGFVGYFTYSAISGSGSGPQWQEAFEEERPALPENPFKLPEGDKDKAEDKDHHDGSEEKTPDFEDSLTPPDVDDPLPEIDVTPNNEGITIQKAPKGSEMTAKEVYEQVVRSTVTVAVTLERGGKETISGGTGIIATSDGYIITNAHVVLNSKSSRVKITTYDGEEYDAVVVGVDRTTDLAIVKTNDYGFIPAEFGDSEQLSIGDPVIAIGNPGGAKFSGSMTGGYVSGLDRAVGAYSENGMTYLQTDAAINPGNSGGPLVNLYGQVVGINSSKIITTGFEGMGFAIPVTKAQPIINQLLAGGYVKGRVRLGISGIDTSNLGNYMFSGGPSGFMISTINEDSAFVGTEAQEGDVIVALDDETVTCLEEISNLLLRYSPGDTVTVTLYRPVSVGKGETIKVEISLLEDKGETQQ